MKYQVIARKFRPQLFDDVVGQKPIIQTLQNAIQMDRIGHAYLFSGPRGVGKTTTARILAKGLNCVKGPTVTPCNECPSCLEIAAGKSTDVFEIDAASNTGVDNIRELRESAKYAAARNRYKIFIIDEVHMLSTSAFNALLKILEEPPSHVVFIMATTERHKLPATILSRCQQFVFRTISPAEIQAHLRQIADREGVKIDDRALSYIVKASEGSMRDAQSLLDQIISFSGQQVVDEDVRDVLGFAREAAAVVRRPDIARRGGQAVAEHVRDDDEIPFRVERAARADQPLRVVVLGAVRSRVDDHIAARAVEPAVCLVGELCIPQCQFGLQRYVPELEDLVIG